MAPGPTTKDAATARAGRRLALIIAAAGILFVAGRVLEAALGLSNRTMALWDLAVLGVFAWAVINAIMIWRARQSDEEK